MAQLMTRTSAGTWAPVSQKNPLPTAAISSTSGNGDPTATLTSVASSASNVTILAANPTRVGAIVFNESTAVLYLKFGATASATSYTVQIPAGGYFEFPSWPPYGVYSGQVDGIWASANGSARVTELAILLTPHTRSIVPLYAYPTATGSDWDKLQFTPPFAVMANPASGPGSSVDSNYARAIAQSRSYGVKVLGYVNTNYGGIALSTVTSQVDTWRSLYGQLDGFFFDLTPTAATASLIAYVQQICAYVKHPDESQFVVCNPGAYPLDPGYIDPPDTTCVWEGDYSANSYLAATVSSWATTYVANNPPEKFLHLVYNVPDAASMRAALQHSAVMRAGYFYAASGNSAWPSLPSYFVQEVNA